MTQFTKPDLINCPHCHQKYYRQVLGSFKSIWQKAYSDSSTMIATNNIMVNETRCIQCQNIIHDVEDLPAIQVKPLKPFWRNWLLKHNKYLFIPQPSIDVYLELFDNTGELQEKRNFAVKAYQGYNQNFLMFGKERIASDEMQNRYREMTNFLLDQPPTPINEEYNLLCADIYRLRGDFSRSKKMYNMVIDDKFDHIVRQGSQWCDMNNASLMAIKGNPHQSKLKVAV